MAETVSLTALGTVSIRRHKSIQAMANAEEEKNEGAALQEIIIEAPKEELKDTFEDFMPLPTAKFKVKKEEIETINVVTVRFC